VICGAALPWYDISAVAEWSLRDGSSSSGDEPGVRPDGVNSIVLEPSLILIAVILPLALLIALPILAVRAMRMPFERKFRRVYEGLELRREPVEGDVFFHYCTYDGVFAWTTTTPHAGFLPPEDARQLLSRLFRYNVCYGLFTVWFLFRGLLVWITYHVQRRSIDGQELNPLSLEDLRALTEPPPLSDGLDPHHVTKRPSFICRAGAVVMYLLALLLLPGIFVLTDLEERLGLLVGALFFVFLGRLFWRAASPEGVQQSHAEQN